MRVVKNGISSSVGVVKRLNKRLGVLAAHFVPFAQLHTLRIPDNYRTKVSEFSGTLQNSHLFIDII